MRFLPDVFRSYSRIMLIASVVGLATPGLLLAQSPDDDRYESENKSTTISKSVLDAKSPFDVPMKIDRDDLDDEKMTAAIDIPTLSGLLFDDVWILGRVESVFIPRGNERVILNFGTDHRVCFKVVIDQRNFYKFGTEDPKRIGRMYERKTVAVDGLLTTHQNLPQMIVTLPHQLKIVKGK